MKKREQKKKKMLTLDRHLTILSLDKNRYTLTTQNGQPLYKWPLPPFIDQGGERLTMWDHFPPLLPYPHLQIQHVGVQRCTSRVRSLRSGFLLWTKIFTTTVSCARVLAMFKVEDYEGEIIEIGKYLSSLTKDESWSKEDFYRIRKKASKLFLKEVHLWKFPKRKNGTLL